MITRGRSCGRALALILGLALGQLEGAWSHHSGHPPVNPSPSPGTQDGASATGQILAGWRSLTPPSDTSVRQPGYQGWPGGLGWVSRVGTSGPGALAFSLATAGRGGPTGRAFRAFRGVLPCAVARLRLLSVQCFRVGTVSFCGSRRRRSIKASVSKPPQLSAGKPPFTMSRDPSLSGVNVSLFECLLDLPGLTSSSEGLPTPDLSAAVLLLLERKSTPTLGPNRLRFQAQAQSRM